MTHAATRARRSVRVWWVSAFAGVLIMQAAPAFAAEEYEGTWATDLAQCKAPQEDMNAPLVIQKDRYDQHEAHCTFKSVTPGSPGEWKISSECTVEGAEQPYDFSLVVSGDTLTVSDDSGSRDLLRCK